MQLQIKVYQENTMCHGFLHAHHSIFIRTVITSKFSASLMQSYIHVLSCWCGTEINCTVHFALPKRPINQFILFQQSIQHAVKAYFSNIYTVTLEKKQSVWQFRPTSHLHFNECHGEKIARFIAVFHPPHSFHVISHHI